MILKIENLIYAFIVAIECPLIVKRVLFTAALLNVDP